jgi:hypothetical protein
MFPRDIFSNLMTILAKRGDGVSDVRVLGLQLARLGLQLQHEELFSFLVRGDPHIVEVVDNIVHRRVFLQDAVAVEEMHVCDGYRGGQLEEFLDSVSLPLQVKIAQYLFLSYGTKVPGYVGCDTAIELATKKLPPPISRTSLVQSGGILFYP